MKIEELPLGAILPYEFNVRHHKEEQVDRIVQSIKTIGWTSPIIIDENGVILAGHGRFFAADKMGLAKVPCIRIEGKTEAEKRAYRIADNKLTEDSTWAFNNLELELGWLEDHKFEMEWCGLEELAQLFSKEAPEEEDGDGISESDPMLCECPSCEEVFDAKKHRAKA